MDGEVWGCNMYAKHCAWDYIHYGLRNSLWNKHTFTHILEYRCVETKWNERLNLVLSC